MALHSSQQHAQVAAEASKITIRTIAILNLPSNTHHGILQYSFVYVYIRGVGTLTQVRELECSICTTIYILDTCMILGPAP